MPSGNDIRYFFTAVDLMATRRHEQKEFDLTKPRLALYK